MARRALLIKVLDQGAGGAHVYLSILQEVIPRCIHNNVLYGSP